MNKFDSISFVIRSNKMCPTLCSSFCSTWQSRVDRNCTGKENFPRNEFSIRNELTGERNEWKSKFEGRERRMKMLNESVYFTPVFTRRMQLVLQRNRSIFTLERPERKKEKKKKFATGSNESCEPWKYVGLVPIIVPNGA